MSNTNKRVVVTGIGIVSPLGLDTTTTWASLIDGQSGIDYITLFDAEPLETKFGGEVKGFQATDHMNPKEARHTDRFAQLAVAASREAIEQSGILASSSNQDDVGVIIGSGIGGLSTLFEQTKVLLDRGPGRVSPFLVPMMISDMAAAQVSISLGLKGPNLCTTSACSSGSDAIGAAYEMIKHGEAKAMLAGGSESIMNQLGFAAFNALKALSTRNAEPKLASRPFDTERDGFVISEGAAILVLEESNHARERGAEILAEVLSYGASADAFHITQPIESGEGAARAMKTALDRANIGSDVIDYINAHGTSTQLNDRMETEAIKTVFGRNAYSIPVSSTKSMTGHMIGGAGAIEASICILAIQNGILPPTINLVNPDPDCDLDYVPNVARHTKVNIALSNSFGFGGHNSTLILGRYSEA
jgi:3-oxoacyl-[acyl-carrier-protein] synthase II